MKKFLVAVGVMTAFTGISPAFADQSVINDIEQAGRRFDVKALESLEDSQEVYDSALAKYRLAVTYSKKSNIERANATLAKAASQLEAILENKPNDAEALALLGLVYGTQAGFSPSQAAEYGMKAGQSIAKAKTAAPNNPRVNLVAGINSYFTPTVFGGSKTAAIKDFSLAIASYDGDEDSGYHWGHAEAYVWRGLAQMELGEHEKALSDWQAAVAIAPDYGWAKMLLNKHK